MSRWRSLRSADQALFEEFVREYGDALSALARGLSRDSTAAADLLQESLAKLMESWGRASVVDEPYLYARRLMINASVSSWRRFRREATTFTAEEVVERHGEGSLLWRARPSDHAGATNERLLLLQFLRELPPRQRAVLCLRYLEDLPDSQIALLLGISQVTVRSTALRGLRTLKVRLSANEFSVAGGTAH